MAEEKVKMEVEEEEDFEPQDPLLALADLNFVAQSSAFSAKEKADAKVAMLAEIKKAAMTPYYRRVCKGLGWPVDEKLCAAMEAKNAAELAKLDKAVEDAKRNKGDTDIRDGQIAKALYMAKIGDKDAAIEAIEAMMEQPVGTGQKIDLIFAVIRMANCFGEVRVVGEYVARAKELVEKGGDWERRNLLKVYEATYLVQVRKFKDAAPLFLDSVATFTCTAMYSYEKLITYAVIAAIITLDRRSFQKRVVKSPEILQVVEELSEIKALIQSLFQCKYKELFASIAKVSDTLKRDRYFEAQCGWWLREIRIVGYSQFLRSYRSVTMASMAQTFGVSLEFLDRELARFIAAGRLNCKVDQVNGVVETNRPDAKALQYANIISEGDALLGRIQKLSNTLT